jgi:ribonuclease HII
MPAKKIQRVIFTKNTHEQAAWAQESVVCGIDEVGRGCLAGPLVTAAVILPPHKNSRLIKDSKILTESEREKAALWIFNNAWHGIGAVHHRIIDQHNVWQATLIAMKRALINLLANCPWIPQAILVDAMPLKLSDTHYRNIPVHHFPKGESLSSSIAAASIVAKVHRDRLMSKLDSIIPGYSLEQHKGYATDKHCQSLFEHQKSIIHRTSFLSFMQNPRNKNPIAAQQSIFMQESHELTQISDTEISLLNRDFTHEQ